MEKLPQRWASLVLRAPWLTEGYYKEPQKGTELWAGGWLHTGDLAYKDADDYYFIVDRLKDMIINNGENIYPREIEEFLYKLEGVKDGRESAMGNRLVTCCDIEVS